MIKKRTTLIIGAGASHPYGFPTGAELIELIINNLADSGYGLRKALLHCGMTDDYLDVFRNELSSSRPRSIDSFIKRDARRKTVGKMCIAYLLMEKERDSIKDGIGLVSTTDDWYAILKQAIETDVPEQLTENTLSVVTFNYDRSLQYFLARALLSDYGHEHKDTVYKALKRIEFIHVYGKLGKMPWESGDVLEYGKRFDLNELANISSRILAMGETASDASFYTARQHMRDSDHVVFLGFGYHKENIRYLGLKDIGSNGRLVTGTRKGLSPLIVKGLVDEYPALSRLQKVSRSFNCSELLHEEVVLDRGLHAGEESVVRL